MAVRVYEAKLEREKAQAANEVRLQREREARKKQKRAEVERLTIAFKYCSGDDAESERLLADLIAAEESYVAEVCRVDTSRVD